MRTGFLVLKIYRKHPALPWWVYVPVCSPPEESAGSPPAWQGRHAWSDEITGLECGLRVVGGWGFCVQKHWSWKKKMKMKGIQASQWTGGKPQRKQLQDAPTGSRSWEACSLNLQPTPVCRGWKRSILVSKLGLPLYFKCLSIINATSNQYIPWLVL